MVVARHIYLIKQRQMAEPHTNSQHLLHFDTHCIAIRDACQMAIKITGLLFLILRTLNFSNVERRKESE